VIYYIKMVNYEQGKIYKLISNHTTNIYIGSTCNEYLSNRKSSHCFKYRQWIMNKNKQHYVTSFDIIKYGDCQIILIENFPCNSKEELEARERYWIEKLNCVNKYIPTRTQKEYWEDNKVLKKEINARYRKKNVDFLKRKVQCECGCYIVNNQLKRHQTTNKHILLMNKINNKNNI